MGFWLPALPPEIAVHLVKVVPVEDRDALLVTLGPLVRALYRADLAKQFPPAAVRGAAAALRLLRRPTTTLTPGSVQLRGIGAHEYGLFLRADIPSGWLFHRNILPYRRSRPSYIPVDRAGDALAGAVLVGTNVRWIRMIIGAYTAEGTTQHYRAAEGRRVLRYTPPRFHDCCPGFPLVAMAMYEVSLECNPDGRDGSKRRLVPRCVRESVDRV